MVAITKVVWHMASTAKNHLQQMDEALIKSDRESAAREFEKAWRLMSDARRAFLTEIAAEHTQSATGVMNRTCCGTGVMADPEKLSIP